MFREIPSFLSLLAGNFRAKTRSRRLRATGRPICLKTQDAPRECSSSLTVRVFAAEGNLVALPTRAAYLAF
jgi:hypothetical protein